MWWYKINRELRDYSQAIDRPLNNDPAVSVWAIIFFAAVTVGTTTQRLRFMQYEVQRRPNALSNIGVAVLLHAVILFHTVYLQYALNDLWHEAGAKSAT